jgi:uncharacterized protein (TIGR02466 family)
MQVDYKEIKQISLFPTRIYTAQLADLAWCDDYQRIVEQMQASEGTRNSQGQWSSPDDLDQRPEWLPLRDMILHSLDITLKDRGVKFKAVRMNCMWANAHYQGSCHDQHHHPNAMFSGVVYINCPEPAPGDFYIRDPRLQAHQYVYDYEDNRLAEYDYWSITPKAGQIIIFPSWLEHGTRPGKFARGQRISVSFNCMLECEMLQNHTVRAEYR